MIGVHKVWLSVPPADAVDISCLVDSVTIRYGREDTSSQPDAYSATVEISLDTDVDPYPGGLDVDSVITVTTTYNGHVYDRYQGSITDINQDWNDAGPDTPNRQSVQVIATNVLADLGRRVIGDTPWGQELDGARISRIMSAAGILLNQSNSDPGTVQIIARDIDTQPALDVARSTADSASGVVWTTKMGIVRYADADHRRNTPVSLSLDACDILVSPTWSRTTEGLINSVSIGYGVTPAGGEQPRYTASNPASISKYETYGFTTTTELAAAADAQVMGDMLLIRNGSPVWMMPDLPVDVAGLDDTQTDALLRLEMHDLVSLTGLPAANTAPTSAALWVEGWSEVLEFGRHELTLTVSGYCRTAPPPHWDDLAPTTTWDSVPATMTWDDAACFGGPLVNLGRWDDVPATMRWNTVPTAATWDTWGNYLGGN